MPNPDEIGPRALFLVGRDPMHPAAAGGDVQAWQWAVHLVCLGWKVDFVCQSAPGQPKVDELDGVQIFRLGTGMILPVRAAAHYRRLSGDVVLIYEDPIGAGRAPYFSPLYAKVPIIAVWHQVSAKLLGSLHSRIVASAIALVEKIVAHFYRDTLLWAPSIESATEIAKELCIPRRHIAVVPPTLAEGIEIAKEGIATAPVLLCLGVMRPYKNFDHVILALPTIRQRVPDARLVVAGRRGSVENEAHLANLVRSLGLDDVVEFRFDVTDAERQKLMRNSAALVLPSLLEGFGIVSIEANAEGTPVIASSGVPEAAVADEENGLRYRYAEIDALATQAIRLLKSADLRQRLANNSLKHAALLTTAAVAPRFDALVAAALRRDDDVTDLATFEGGSG